MFEILCLIAITWLTYWGAINNGFVSDDIEGILNYNGEFRGWDYGNLTKWIFYRLFQKSPRRNHIFSIIVHNANVVLLYLFLLNFFSPTLSLMTSILFAIHPIGTQAVAWISARGYLIGLFWMLFGLNLIFLSSPLSVLFADHIFQFSLVILAYILLYFFGIHAQFAVMMTFVIYFLLGYPFLALIGLIISFAMGFDIVKKVIGVRRKVFKEQAMEETTQFHHRRFIVVVKSLWYYTRLCLFPKRMGLYHVYGYHYTPELIKEDRTFWQGFLLIIGMGILWYFGDFTVKFGLIWYLSYLFIFLNWITIHQFVSERYCYIPNIGLCLLISYSLINFSKYLPINYLVPFALICGLYMMRTWLHLPTYQDEVPFYQSNIWNFPNSEVAFTNLGVTYIKRGLIGSAMDMWLISLKINPDYDVAHYNISSTLKGRGDLKKAYEHLKKAVECPKCHFKEIWTKELTVLEHELRYIEEVNDLRRKLTAMQDNPEKRTQALALQKQLNDLQNLHKQIEDDRQNKIKLMQQKEKELETQLVSIKEAKGVVEKPIPPEQLVQLRDQKFKVLQENFIRLEKNENPQT